MKKYTQITTNEREIIYQLLKSNKSITKIAQILGRNKSSISREIIRNSTGAEYLPNSADNKALRRKERELSKIAKYPKVKAYIIQKLIYDKCSPKMIANKMKLEKHVITISHETIYSYIYSHDGQKLGLHKYLLNNSRK